MRIFVLDNYDSFTYNLVEAIRVISGSHVTVKRNDQFAIEELESFDKIVLSPGPGIPDEAGLLKSVIEKYKATKSILGVCLGMQAIGEVCGASLMNLPRVFHGVTTPVKIIARDEVLFNDLDEVIDVGRYHSWAVDPATIPEEIKVTAVDYNNIIMAISHKVYDLKGMQFHPESIMTTQGYKMLANWLGDRQKISLPTQDNFKFNHGSINESKLFF